MDTPMAYAARRPGHPGYVAVRLELPDDLPALAREVARWIRRGDIVERLPAAEASAGLRVWDAAADQSFISRAGRAQPRGKR